MQLMSVESYQSALVLETVKRSEFESSTLPHGAVKNLSDFFAFLRNQLVDPSLSVVNFLAPNRKSTSRESDTLATLKVIPDSS